MESMLWKEEWEKGKKLGEFYKSIFESRFGSQPAPFGAADYDLFSWIIRTYGENDGKELLVGYLLLDDEWLKNNGYPLSQFKRMINAIIVSRAKPKNLTSPKWVIGLTQSGFPIISETDKKIEGHYYKTVLYTDWLKQSHEEKMQAPREKLERAGNDISLWISNWAEEEIPTAEI